MSLNGGLVGVTSHITPLPAGEGKGEGPAGVGPLPAISCPPPPPYFIKNVNYFLYPNIILTFV